MLITTANFAQPWTAHILRLETVPGAQRQAASDTPGDHRRELDPQSGPSGGSRCPRCGSDRILSRPPFPQVVLMGIVSLLFGAPFVGTNHIYRCEACATTWRDQQP